MEYSKSFVLLPIISLLGIGSVGFAYFIYTVTGGWVDLNPSGEGQWAVLIKEQQYKRAETNKEI